MLCLILILPIIYIIVGTTFYKHAPKDINPMAGWRTKNAMKSQENWELANKYGGALFGVMGVVETVAGAVILVSAWNASEKVKAILVVAAVVVEMFLILPAYINVESALKSRESVSDETSDADVVQEETDVTKKDKKEI